MTSLTWLAGWCWLLAWARLGLKTSACYFFPMDLDWVSPKIVTETSGEESQKDQSQCASTYQASTCITLANILLVKATHVSKSRVKVRRKQTSFHGKRVSKHTSEGSELPKALLGTAITLLSFKTQSHFMLPNTYLSLLSRKALRYFLIY